MPEVLVTARFLIPEGPSPHRRSGTQPRRYPPSSGARKVLSGGALVGYTSTRHSWLFRLVLDYQDNIVGLWQEDTSQYYSLQDGYLRKEKQRPAYSRFGDLVRVVTRELPVVAQDGLERQHVDALVSHTVI